MRLSASLLMGQRKRSCTSTQVKFVQHFMGKLVAVQSPTKSTPAEVSQGALYGSLTRVQFKNVLDTKNYPGKENF